MYGTGFPQIPPPVSANQFVSINNALPPLQPPHMSTHMSHPVLPPQIPPPRLEMLPAQQLGRMDIMPNLLRLQYHHPPHNFPHQIHTVTGRYPGPPPVSDSNLTFVPQPQLSQPPVQPAVQPMQPSSLQPSGMSTPVGKTVFTPDYSSHNTSFTGIGTRFDTPPQRSPVKPVSEFAGNNTSFTGIGLNFVTPGNYTLVLLKQSY